MLNEGGTIMIVNRARLITGLIFASLFALALTVSVIAVKAKRIDDKQAKASIQAEQAIESIRTAIAARPGSVRGVEVENEDGKVICEVKILATDGKIYEVEVDVATNVVEEVEEDDDNEDNG
jgi:hypothetical protein